jgi:spore maturation protein CgeB
MIALFTSCSEKYYTVACDKALIGNRNAWIWDSISDRIKVSSNEKYIVKSIVWNTECNCGLIDISKNIQHSYNYSPLLVSKNHTVTKMVSDKDGLEKNQETIFPKYKEEHSEFFTEKQFNLMKNRLDKKILHFGSSLMNSGLDVVSDSILLERYLTSNDTILTIRLK